MRIREKILVKEVVIETHEPAVLDFVIPNECKTINSILIDVKKHKFNVSESAEVNIAYPNFERALFVNFGVNNDQLSHKDKRIPLNIEVKNINALLRVMIKRNLAINESEKVYFKAYLFCSKKQ